MDVNIYIYLEALAFLLNMSSLGEIGDHAEAAAGILDDGDSGSPAAEGGVGGALRGDIEVVSQVLLHHVVVGPIQEMMMDGSACIYICYNRELL